MEKRPSFDKVNKTYPLSEIDHLLHICTLLPLHPDILEVGTFMGRTTAAMADVRPDANIITLDIYLGKMWDYERIKDEFPYKGYLENIFNHKMWDEQLTKDYLSHWDNIQAFNCKFPDEWPLPKENKFDLIFEDGNHGSPSTMKSFPKCIELLKPGGYLALHDYGVGGVTKAIEAFVQPHPQMSYHSRYKLLTIWNKDT